MYRGKVAVHVSRKKKLVENYSATDCTGDTSGGYYTRHRIHISASRS